MDMKTNSFQKKYIRPSYLLLLLFLTLINCKDFHNNSEDKNSHGELNDTLKVGTTYGPLTYFIYRGEPMGYEYELIEDFIKFSGKELKLEIMSSLRQLIDSLENGAIDLIAYPVPYIEEYKENLVYVGPEELTWQVLIQNKKSKVINEPVELIGEKVVVNQFSKYYYRLKNLDDELGGGIDIVGLNNTYFSEEDYIKMVANGLIPFTVVDSDIATVNLPYYPELDMNLKISLEQKSSWVTTKTNIKLIEQIKNWELRQENADLIKIISKKYFENSRNENDTSFYEGLKELTHKNKKGKISPFDQLFKTYGKKENIDWKLLAAISYNESGFKPDAVSIYGASGLMQIMPVAARAVGVDPSLLFSPEENIKAGARVIQQLDNSFAKNIPDSTERIKFVIAAYNSGIAHILDAMTLAREFGLNQSKWIGNVSETLQWKSKPEFYNHPKVKYGFFRANETTEFVDKVLTTYNFFKFNGSQ